MDGILLIDKAEGWTSHDVVARLRRILGQKRIGHTGTLDPMATGLLVVCLGRATRLVEYMSEHDKRYEGEVELGAETNTDDATGEVVSRAPVPGIGAETLRALEARFTGTLSQVPPAFSAISVGGERSYHAARAGRALDLPARQVVIHSLALEARGPTALRLRLHCGPGTYVRSLARDIGRELGCGGHLRTLRRTAAGGFNIADALTLEQVAAAKELGVLGEWLLRADEGVTDRPAAIVSTAHGEALVQGKAIAVDGAAPVVNALRIYAADGRFLGIGAVDGAGGLRPRKVLV